jgi:VWFA-related protein
MLRISPRCARLAALGCAATLFPVSLTAASPPLASIRSDVRLVTVDAVALDSFGRTVATLTRGDFRVTEDGRPVEIVRFEAVGSNETAAANAGRAFAIVIDDLGTATERSEELRRGVRSFLERGVRGDLIVVTTTSGDAWWRARLPEGLEDLLAVVARCGGKHDDRSPLDRRPRPEATLAAVERGIEALRSLYGRKSLLLVSQGFTSDPRSRRMREVVALSREANAVVYFLDVREQALSSAAAGAEALAAHTGGRSVRSSDGLESGVSRIAAESRAYYLLGFSPPEGRPADAWRQLHVTTTHPALEVRARNGYRLAPTAPSRAAAPKPGEPAPHPAVLQAVDSAHDASGLPMRARVYVLEPGRHETRVLVAAEFDTSRLGPAGWKPRLIEMSTVVRLRDQPLERRYDQVVELKPAPAGATWRAIAREFGLPPGVASARVALREPVTGALGSVSERFEVPENDVLRLSTPILTDRVAQAQAGAGIPRPALAVQRAFPRDGGLYCQFEVIGARKGPDGKADVAAGASVFAANGTRVREFPASPVSTGADGRPVRLIGIDLAGLPEGSYNLVLDVTDEIGNARLRHREPFTIGAPMAQ